MIEIKFKINILIINFVKNGFGLFEQNTDDIQCREKIRLTSIPGIKIIQ